MNEAESTIAFLYVLMTILTITMSAALGYDVWRNHYEHQPLKPLALWVALMCLSQGIHFILLLIARIYRVVYGVVWPGLDSSIWIAALGLFAVSVVGFYASLRRAR